jgi:uncharacterized protein
VTARPAAGLRAWVRRHDLLLYFVLAFLLSWLAWPLVALNPESSPLLPFGPLIAAAVVAALSGGLRELFGQLGRWRSAPRWYLAAVLVPVAAAALAAVVTVAAGGSASVGSTVPNAAQVAATFLSTVLLVGLFEEVGWRGYALPRLQQRMSGRRAALLLGVIWAAWHLPELVSDPTGQRPVIQFVIFVVAQSVFLSWLYNGSAAGLPLVIISHATVDTAARFGLPPFVASSPQLVWWSLAGVWVVTAVIVAVCGRWSRPAVRDLRDDDRAATRRAGDAQGSA